MLDAVFEPYGTVLMTSATLSVAGEFGFWAGRVGVPLVSDERGFGRVPSPLDCAHRRAYRLSRRFSHTRSGILPAGY